MCKISIVIPVYNAEKYLDKCLESIVNQTYSNIEIICINDGSSDNSLKVLENYAQNSKIKIINQKNQGVSVARNAGIDIAKGEYILFVDADDWIEIDACEKLINKTKLDTYDVIYFNYYGINKNTCREFNVTQKVKNYSKLQLINNNIGVIWNKLYRKDFIKEHNIKFVPNIKISEDAIFCQSLLCENAKITTIDEYLYYYRENNDTSATKDWKDFLYLQVKSLEIFEQTKYFNNMSKIEKLMAVDYWGKLVFSVWSGLPQKKYQKEYNILIKNFLENYDEFEYKDYKNLIGYQRIKFRYWIRLLKYLRNFYFSLRYKVS